MYIGDDTPEQQLSNNGTIPFVLSFTNLKYNVKIRRKFSRSPAVDPITGEPVLSGSKTVLDDISGSARDSEIMAVLGASGSGKSTLIDALANRMAKGSIKGEIKLNGEQLNSKLLKVISAYVMQDDLLFPMLTVEETLMFAAEFRLPRTLSKSMKKHRVQNLIDQLGLRNAARTVIGDEGHRGISGGERRRVSIGTDIIHDPILLFLDEPTSGLDSTSAFMVVKVLQRIARSGSVVIMSIHQPSSRILGLIDRMLFLSRGQIIFNGPPSNLPLFFSDFGHSIPEDESQTEFAIDLIRQLEGSPGGTQSLVEFYKSWQVLNRGDSISENRTNLPLKEAIRWSVSRGKLVSGGGITGPASMVPTFANSLWTEVAVLSKRSFINSRRMPEIFSVRLVVILTTGFILATVFWKLNDSPKGVQERLGFFVFAMSTLFYSCSDALPVFLQERYIFMRETAYNAYRRSSYVLSDTLTSIPTQLLVCIGFAAVTFWTVGLEGSFLFYFLIILASFWTGSSFVTFLSGVVPHVMIGYVIIVAVLAYFLLFSGFIITRDRIPPYWIWFHYISLMKYPYEALMHNEFGDPTKCFVRGIQVFDGTMIDAVPEAMKEKLLEAISETLGMTIGSDTCVTTGPDILKQKGVNGLSKWNCLWVTVASGVFFRILFYIVLLIGTKNKRS